MGWRELIPKMHAHTMRVSALPPRQRYLWLLTWLAGVATYGYSMFMMFTDGKDGQFGHTWGPGIMIAGIALCTIAFIWQSARKDIDKIIVKRSTVMLDEHYEELCDQYWKEP